MKTIRRIYFYLLSFIGLQLVVWGLFTLISGTWTTSGLIGFQDILPTGLSLVLIGIPVFIIHFRVIQKDAASDSEENESLIRAIFLFLTQIAALGAVAVSSCGFIDQLLKLLLSKQTFVLNSFLDGLAAIVLNLIVWVLLFNYLMPYETFFQKNESFKITRRIYRYIWLVAGIATTVITIQNQIADLFFQLDTALITNYANQTTNKLAIILVWSSIWAWTWRNLQKSFADPQENTANIRYILNLCITIVSLAPWLVSSGYLVYGLLNRLFEGEAVFNHFFSTYNIELSVLFTFFILWLYYEKQLFKSLHVLQDAGQRQLIQRIYSTILSTTGNILTFLGLWSTILWVIDSIFKIQTYGAAYDKLCSGLSLLVIGIPLWITHWLKLQKETLQEKNSALSARKALLRRFYLYFFVFGSVIGIMVTAGSFLYNLVFVFLGRPQSNLAHFVVSNLFYIALFTIWLIYHSKVMRDDNQFIKSSDQNEGLLTSILLIKSSTAEELLNLIEKNIQANFPGITLLAINETEIEDTDIHTYQVLIVPTNSVLSQSQSINELNGFKGKLLLLPESSESVISVANQSKNEISRNVLSILNQIDHGLPVKIQSGKNVSSIILYIVGGIISFFILWQLIFGVVMAIAD